MKTSPAFCHGCTYRINCTKTCSDIEDHLRTIEKGRRGDTACISSDLIDRTRGKENGCIDWGDKREAWERRCQVVQETIEYFKGFGGKALECFLIWQYTIEDTMSQEKISQLTGFSQQYISQILKKIRDGKKFY